MLNSTPNTLTVKIINNQELEIIAQGENFLVDLEAALKILGKSLEWWRTFPPGKTKRLKNKGFSGQIETCNIFSANKSVKNLQTISYKDWLVLTSYLAEKRNIQAINLLTYLAQEGLQNQLNTFLKKPAGIPLHF
ncbi:hypothetical protein [Gloeothece verrucosa]|uniref:Uncharacterized protein n=1 Tax=Gloeothece verrucosa (strain PCC 7822) TaxID=497965 RepID=E0UNR7_GLOV7|nr:hypothetical protein [Gloeothece verrucosa]ADN18597.1 hypothetical protein Cyan7822_6959 [Gloeothece verrucosa PCC 7822]